MYIDGGLSSSILVYPQVSSNYTANYLYIYIHTYIEIFEYIIYNRDMMAYQNPLTTSASRAFTKVPSPLVTIGNYKAL